MAKTANASNKYLIWSILPSACSSPVRMQESPFPTSSSSQESLVNLIQPVGRHKQVKRKRDSSSGLLVFVKVMEANNKS
ncbi:hypothetical protein F7725_013503 [Dissostichus mawsoni]|uniref:Uncharacterized protein n=1 Tax=Dissostichus mawsoni TaxID=36200 RepID=A0A7J5Y413_DISMA|nr:hypothetical protein F7725_013503 [Dissostichus mawsoni]